MDIFPDFLVLFASFLLIAIIRTLSINPGPILGVYQRAGGFYWLKVACMYSLLTTRKIISGQSKNKIDYTKLDKPQKLSTHPSAVDAVYFNGSNKDGDYLVLGTSRRKNGLIDGFLYLLVGDSKLGILETPKLPSTSLYQTVEKEEYEAEGLKVAPLEPMKKWRIQYEGRMKKYEDREDYVVVKLEAEFLSGEFPIFNFDTDMDPLAMAKSMAYEKFTRDYFESLKTNHQTHYEQHGNIKGTVQIGSDTYKIDVNAVRDHTFGLKQNGDRFNVGIVCLPISFSRLTLGYVYSADDKKIHPVKSCDLQLYQHGEDGNPPLDYALSFEAGGRNYTMKVKVLHSPHFYLSKDWESKVVERLCTFDINGVRGWGAAEWQYRNVLGKKVSDYNGF